MPEDLTTGVLTNAPVVPANITFQVPAPQTSATLVNPAQSVNLEPFEQRVRHFQAEADKAKADREMLLKQIEALTAQQAAQMEGVRQAAQSAQDAALKAQAFAENERAERLRAEAVLQHPELAPYFQFIPATTDQTKLQSHIDQFGAVVKAEREKLEAQIKASTPATPAGPTPLTSLYPQNASPSGAFGAAAPATPSASGVPGTSAVDDLNARLTQAREEALAKNDDSIFERALAEAAARVPSLLS